MRLNINVAGLSIAALGLILQASSANAAVYLKEVYTGTVDNIGGPNVVVPGASIGDQWTATFIFDLSKGTAINNPGFSQTVEGGTNLHVTDPLVSDTLVVGSLTFHPDSGDLDYTYIDKGTGVGATVTATTGSAFNVVIQDNSKLSPFPDSFGPLTYFVTPDVVAESTWALDDGSFIEAHLTEAVFADVSVVPEPATWALFILGFGGIGMVMRRQRDRRLATA